MSENLKYEPELIADYHCHTGEGPIWHSEEELLYWTDIPTGRMFRLDPLSGKHEQFYSGSVVGGFTIQKDGKLLLFMSGGAISIWHDGIHDYIIKDVPKERGFRFNDVITDPRGRVFCGTMSDSLASGTKLTEEHLGRLYRLELDGTLTLVLDGIGISNGMGFTSDFRTMYFTDTAARHIYLFDYDVDTGNISRQRIFVEVPYGQGLPDGMTVDSDGFIWSARWDGSALYRYSPHGVEDKRILFPAKKVSSVTFGGKDFSDIYVTTAGGQNKDLEGSGAGGLFRLNLGIKGSPEFLSGICLL